MLGDSDGQAGPESFHSRKYVRVIFKFQCLGQRDSNRDGNARRLRLRLPGTLRLAS